MDKNYYECYSYNLMRFLLANGIEPLRATIHHKTKNTIWIYRTNYTLSKLLTEWTNNKNTTRSKA